MCLIYTVPCRCSHTGNIQTRCPANPGRGFTPRCKAYGIRFTGREPIAKASFSRDAHPNWSDVTRAECPRCGRKLYLWGVGREMESLGMVALSGRSRRRASHVKKVHWA
ncbi:hypothetical protein BST61_g2006 [Cercospora zeina]